MPDTTNTARAACTASVHGTLSAYRKGCRCPETLAARARYKRALRKGLNHLVVNNPMTGVVGSQRRVDALMAMGWPLAEIARRLGYAPHELKWMRPGARRMAASTARKVAALADEWGMELGPSKELREHAAKERKKKTGGWTVLAWEGVDIDDPNAEPKTDASPEDFPEGERDARNAVDMIAVMLAVAGSHPAKSQAVGRKKAKLRAVDRKAAVGILVHRKHPDGEPLSSLDIAKRLGVAERSVDRDRAELGLRVCDLERAARAVEVSGCAVRPPKLAAQPEINGVRVPGPAGRLECLDVA